MLLTVGYDPGGNDAHGVAAVVGDGRRVLDVLVATEKTVETAFHWFLTLESRRGLILQKCLPKI